MADLLAFTCHWLGEQYATMGYYSIEITRHVNPRRWGYIIRRFDEVVATSEGEGYRRLKSARAMSESHLWRIYRI